MIEITVRLLATAALLLSLAPPATAQTTQTLTFPSVADVYVDSASPAVNLNADARLRAKAPTARITYLRFAVSGVAGRTVTSARLRLGVVGAANSGGSVHAIGDSTWNEATVTFNTRPAIDGPVLATLGAVTLGATVEFDLGSSVPADGVYNFAIDSTSTDGVSYNSTAATSGQKPELVLTVATGGPPTIAITQPAPGASFFAGDPITLQGTAADAGGADLSAAIIWSSSLAGPLGTGAVVMPALGAGAHTLTATVQDAHGVPASATVGITVVPRPAANTAPLVAITAPTTGQTLTAGSPVQFTGTASDLEDGPLTAALQWTSDRDGVLGAGGTVTRTLSPGAHVITASVTDSGGLAASHAITVAVAAAVLVEVPAIADASVDAGIPGGNFGTSPTLRVDANTARIAYLRFDTARVGTRPVTHATLRVQIDDNPGAESTSGGTLSRLSSNDWQESTITYATRPPVDGPALGSQGPVVRGQTVEFDVSAVVTGAGIYNFALTNTSSDEATYRARESAAPPTLVLTVAGNAPAVAITAPVAGTVVFHGTAVALAATATDLEDGALASRLQWSSNRDGMLGSGGALTASALTTGLHTITATATDDDGLMGQASVTLRVRGPNAAPTIAITTPPDATSVPFGTALSLAATASDDFDGDLGPQVHWTSSRDGTLGTGAALTLSSLRLGTHTLTATVTDSDGATASASVQVTITPTPPTVTVAAPVDGTRVFTGTTVTLQGTASDAADGPLTPGLVWRSDRDGALGTGGTVAAPALSIGTHRIEAAATNSAGLTTRVARTLLVRSPNTAPTVAVDAPANGTTLLSGRPVLLAATATDPEDGMLGAAVRWSSSAAGPLGTGAVLVVPGLSVGTHTLTATVTDTDGTTASANITVTVMAGTLSFVAIADTYVDSGATTTKFGTATGILAGTSPTRQAFLRFTIGGLGGFAIERTALRLTAAAGASDGAAAGGVVRAITNSTWSEATTTYSTRPTIDGAVLATAGRVNPGQAIDLDVSAGIAGESTVNLALTSTATDWVKYQSREATTGKPQLVVTLTQNTAPAVTITAPAAGARVLPGTPVTLVARALDAEDGDLSATIQWSSSLDGPIGSGASRTLTTLRSGTHVLTARVTDARGVAAQATVTLSVAHTPQVTIVAPAGGAVVFTNDLPLTLRAQAHDVEDGDLGARVTWRSDRDGALATGAEIAATLGIGTHTVTARATDDDGLTGEATITVRVRGPNVAPVVSVTAPAGGTVVPAGTALVLAATADDDFDGDLTAALRWSSDRDGPLCPVATCSVVLREGSHVLTATVTDSNGADGAAQVPVTIAPSPPQVTIAAPAGGARLFTGVPILFQGTATDATDGTLSPSLAWISDRDGAIGTGPSFATGALSVGTHVVTARVTDAGGLAAEAERTVVVRPPNGGPTLTLLAPAATDTLLAGRPVLLAATAMDAEDGDLGGQVAWTSSRDGALGTGGALIVPALSAGTHTLTAAVVDQDGRTASASVTVGVGVGTLAFPAVADTYVDANAATTKFGTAALLTIDASPVRQAFLRFAVSGLGGAAIERAVLRLTVGSGASDGSLVGGTVQRITDGTWSEATTTYTTRPALTGVPLATVAAVTASQVVEFDVTPAVTGNGTYDFALTSTSSDAAHYQSREASSGTPQLVVHLAHNGMPVVTIGAPAAGAHLMPVMPVTCTGAATDAEGGDLSGQMVWQSDRDGALGTGRSITVPSLSSGAHTITARVTDAGGAVGEARLALTVAFAPTIAIDTPASGAIVFLDQLPVTLAAHASDVEDGDLGGTIVWRSDRDGALATGASIAASLSLGTHVVTAAVTDADGLHREAQLTLRVRGPNVGPTLAISAPGDGTSVPAGTPLALAAVASDDFDGDLGAQVQWSSSRDGSLGTGAALAVLLREGSHTLTATVTDSDGVAATAAVGVSITTSPPVVTIASPAPGTAVFTASPLPFSGMAIDPTDGDVSAGLRWVSDLDGLLGYGPAFTSDRLSTGMHVVTAAADDLQGLTGTAERAVRVRPPNDAPTVVVTSPDADGVVLAGTPLVLAGSATDPEDGILSASLRWTSSRDGVLGTGSSLLVPALSAGTHLLAATVTDQDGAAGNATITLNVLPATLVVGAVADTYVDSGKPTTKFGTATGLQASSSPVRQAFYRFDVTGLGSLSVQQATLRLTVSTATADGSIVGGIVRTSSNTTWTEAATTYNTRPPVDGPVLGSRAKVVAKQVVDFDVSAAVTGAGPVTFALTSTSTDSVKYASREASTGKPQLVLTLQQNTAPVVRITTPADGATVSRTAPVTLAATAVDAESGDLGAGLEWTSNVDGVLGTGPSLLVTRLSPGPHTITAVVSDTSERTGADTIGITVGYRPAVTIAAPRDRAIVFTTALPLTLSATASDVEDGDLTAQLAWTSDRDGALGAGGALSRTLSIGTHVLTATVTDGDGQQGEGRITVRVRGPNAAPTVAIIAPADGAAIPAGTPVPVATTATDDFDGDLSGFVGVSSSRDGALGAGASRTAVLTEGVHTLTAAATDSDGVTSTASIGVTITPTPPAVTITAPGPDTTAVFGSSLSFAASALDATDGDVSGGLTWTSDRDGIIGTGATFATTTLSEGVHVVMAAVTDAGGLTGQATVVVTVIRVPAVVILLPEMGARYLDTTAITFVATATDVLDGDVGATLTWTSDRIGPLGTGPLLTVPHLPAGLHTITAQAINTAGNPATATVTIEVQPATLVFEPVADAYVDEAFPSARLGTATDLQVGVAPFRQAFVRFTVSGAGTFPIATARVRLTAASSGGAGGGYAGTLFRMTNTTWSETTVSFSSQPTVEGPALDSLTGPVAAGEQVSFDAGAVVTGDGTYSFALQNPTTDVVRYDSREASNRPRLVVTFRQPEVHMLPAVTIGAPATGATLFDDSPVALTATAMDRLDGDLSAAILWRSDVDGPLGSSGAVTVPRLSRGAHVLTASVPNSLGLTGASSVSVTVADRPPTLAITSPSDLTLVPGGTALALVASATDDTDGDLSAAIAWSSSQDGALGTGASVTVTTLSPGEHVLTAAATNSLGVTGTATVVVFIDHAPPRVAITAPATGTTVAEGTRVEFAATATDVEDGDLSATVVWSSDLQGALGTGAALDVTLTVVGTHHIRAQVTDQSSQTRTAEAVVTVTLAPPALTVTAPANGFSTAGAIACTATAQDVRDGSLTSAIRWTSSLDGSLGVGGAVTAPRPSLGRHTITAQVTDSSGLTATTAVTVVVGDLPPTVTILAPANGTSVRAGDPLTLSARALDPAEGDVSTRVVWSSNVQGTLGTGGTLTTSALARGTHVLTARATDTRGLSGTAQVRVTITGTAANLAPVITITAPAAGTSVASGAAVVFAATATDDSGDLSASLTWASDLDGFLGTGASLPVTSLSPGAHQVTAAVSDASGALGNAAVSVTVFVPDPSFPAVADAGTDELVPDTNLGGTATMQVDSQPIRRIHLRFVVSGLGTQPIRRAIVRLRTTTPTSAGGDQAGEIRTVSAPWEELTVTHTNKPLQDGVLLSSVGAVVPAQDVDFDVTAAVTGDGTYNFGLKTLSTNGVEYVAREGGANGPRLIVTQDAPVPTRPTVQITTPADGAQLATGAGVTFAATATDPQDGDLGASLLWRSDRAGVLGTGPTITVTLATGLHVVTATATDSSAQTAATVVRVAVGISAPVVTIVAPAAGATGQRDRPFGFAGAALDPQEGDLSVALAWTSSIDGPIGTGPSFTRALGAGTHTITAAVTDGTGNTTSARVTVTVPAYRAGYEDHQYDPSLVVDLNKPTASKPESKLWYVDGIWWATLSNRTAPGHRIHRLDRGTQTWIDTGVLVDERSLSRQDVLWDGQALYMASRFAGNPAQARLLRFSYHAGAQSWSLNPGFPAPMPGGGTEALTLAKDSTATLWIAYTRNNTVFLARTLGNDTTWSVPFALPTAEATNLYFDDIAGIVALPGQIGVFWSNQNAKKDYFAVHTDGTPATDAAAWRIEVAGTGGAFADDHFNVQVAGDGRVFAAVKTSYTSASQPLMGLLVRSTTGTWSPLYPVGTVAQNPTRPRCLLDEVSRRVYVFYSAFQNNIYYKSSDMDAIAFPTGGGTQFMVANNRQDPGTDGINNPTSTKQSIDPTTGLVVIAATPETARYWHNEIPPVLP